MSKLVKRVVLGAAVGAGAAAVDAYSKDRPVDELARTAALWAGGGVAAGVVVSILGVRRARQAAKKSLAA